ncbi:MAG TPA: putative zinc-binding protein [Ignavibacteriales bacterium]|nr:putative zinc-binding protein [Ignavibacteriales bacterium]
MNEKQIGIVACSGASNTGSYSDLVARKLMQSGKAKMMCLARFSVDKAFAENTKQETEQVIVLDGCPINCAELTMKQNGINKFIHINTTDFHIVKGKTPVTEEKVNEIADHISALIG